MKKKFMCNTNVEKITLATYSEPKKFPMADTSNVICFTLPKDFLI